MNKTNGIDDNKIVDLDAFRKEKYTLKVRVGGYYANLERGIFLHVVGITEPMHTKNAEQHFIVEDHFGNLVTLSMDDTPTDFVSSFQEEFAAAAMGFPNPDDPQVS